MNSVNLTKNKKAELVEASQRFVAMCDSRGGVFMTCTSGVDANVNIKCMDTAHAQAVYRAIIDIARAIHEIEVIDAVPKD